MERKKRVGRVVEIFSTIVWEERYIGKGSWELTCDELNLRVQSKDRGRIRDLADESANTLFAYLIKENKLESFYIKRGLRIPFISIPNCKFEDMIFDVPMAIRHGSHK